jgi:putative glutamine amidotransferase
MSNPLIGLSTTRIKNNKGHPAFMMMEAYVRAVAQAGAAPVMIPLGLSPESLDSIIRRLNGFLFTGGDDINPQVYGSQDHPKVSLVDDDRDRVELELFRLTRQSGKPFLGICRGIQLINVALGGTIYEDILDQQPGSLNHDCSQFARNHLAHPVDLVEESRLGRILGSGRIKVNSLHHQGVRNLAKGVLATASAPDGLVEAFELTDYPFGLAVQWHPEWLQEHQPMRDLFRAFVQAADEQG